MSAKIYECNVMHCRLQPRQRAFNYRVFMLSLDLDDLPKVAWLSYNRFNLFSLDDKDHIALGESGGIRGNLIAWLRLRNVEIPEDARIRLVTFPRVLGYAFNPVSFYYVTTADGAPLLSVAEVGNTFREMKLFVVDGEDKEGEWHCRVAKNFYVSPFSDPGDVFDFRLGLPGETLSVHIDDLKDGEKILLSSVRGEAREISALRLFWYAFKYPLLSLKIIGLIHWHALILWLKKVPYFKKSDRSEVQTDVLKPYRK
jgi:DUF1365 family protein